MCQIAPRTLYNAGYYNITMCKGCTYVGLLYNNVLVSFDQKQFNQFAETVIDLKFQDKAVKFPDGQHRVILNTCPQDIQLGFTYPEFVDFQVGLTESVLMLEIEEMLNKKAL